MTKQLTTQNATITTATVEVKTLTISGKQVTLAVFRQLREEPLIADDGTLNGEPWGRVNYHPDKCGEGYAEHWHIVWQCGSELLRSRVDTPAGFDYVTATGSHLASHWYSSAAADHYLTALVYMGLVAGGDSVLDINHRPSGLYWTEGTPDSHAAKLVLPEALAGTDLFPVKASAEQVAVQAADSAERVRATNFVASKELTEAESSRSTEWRETFTANRRYAVEEAERKHAANMAAVKALIEKWGGFDEVDSAYSSEIGTEEARRRAHRESRITISELPQLFIAV